MRSRLNLLWAIPLGLTEWLLAELLVFAPVFLLALLLCPYWWMPTCSGLSRVNGGVIEVYRWPLAQLLWGNWEDGLEANGYTEAGWFLRNPVSNMRFWPIISTLPSKDVRWCGTLSEVPAPQVPGWFVAWQFPYVGFYWACKSWGLWLGWKLNPRDAQSDAPRDYHYWGLGTVCQLMRW